MTGGSPDLFGADAGYDVAKDYARKFGFGTRIEEVQHFYDRYPKWSLMGKMVADTRSVINDACSRMAFIDSSIIYLTGYSLGGTVALLAAALDNRVKGNAVVSAFSSLRNDKSTEGVKHYSHLHGLIPRLGFFVGYEARIPIDFDILACIAPRHLLVMAPGKDFDHNILNVQQIDRQCQTFITIGIMQRT